MFHTVSPFYDPVSENSKHILQLLSDVNSLETRTATTFWRFNIKYCMIFTEKRFSPKLIYTVLYICTKLFLNMCYNIFLLLFPCFSSNINVLRIKCRWNNIQENIELKNTCIFINLFFSTFRHKLTQVNLVLNFLGIFNNYISTEKLSFHSDSEFYVPNMYLSIQSYLFREISECFNYFSRYIPHGF